MKADNIIDEYLQAVRANLIPHPNLSKQFFEVFRLEVERGVLRGDIVRPSHDGV